MRIPSFRSVAAVLVGLIGACFGVPAFGAVLTVEAPVTMWDKVDNRLTRGTPFAASSFRAFKSWCMQNLRGINLQLIDMADVTVDTNPLDGAIRIYAIYARKQATAPDTYLKIFDDAAVDTAGAGRIALPLFESGKESILFFPDGLPLAAGLVVGAYTALLGEAGATPTTAGDGPNGFLLVG